MVNKLAIIKIVINKIQFKFFNIYGYLNLVRLYFNNIKFNFM